MATTEAHLPGYEAAEALFDACVGQISDEEIESARRLAYIESDEAGVDDALCLLIAVKGTVPVDVVAQLRAEYAGGFWYDKGRLEQLLGMLGV